MSSLNEIDITSWGTGKNLLEVVPKILSNFGIIKNAGLDQSVLAAATAKATPVSADAFPLLDSAAENALKKTTFTDLSAALSNPAATITYNANGTVNTISEIGKTYTFTYNANGTVNTVSDGTATRTCAYTNGNLTSAT